MVLKERRDNLNPMRTLQDVKSLGDVLYVREIILATVYMR